MGRAETDDLSAAQIFYPCMQCADIFFLKADICQLGMDQRKVHGCRVHVWSPTAGLCTAAHQAQCTCSCVLMCLGTCRVCVI